MHWIDKFAKGTFQIYAGNVIEAFQPLDFFHFYPLWYDLWISRIAKVIHMLSLETKTYQEIRTFLPTPSNMRAIIQKIIPTYRGYPIKNIAECRKVVNFFVRMLEESCPGDPFGEESTPYHRPHEVDAFYTNLSWNEGSPKIGRKIGKLITVLGSLVHGHYNDLVTDFGWESYGPYAKEAESLLIRHFPDLRPAELWPEEFWGSVKEVFIYGLYEGVEWKISCVGCHTMVKQGSPIYGLRKYLITADGKQLTEPQIDQLIVESAGKAEKIYQEIRRKNFEELKRMVMIQECYQLKKLFDAARMDWRPTDEMLLRIKDKSLMSGLVPHGKIMTNIEEYRELFGINQFVREVIEG